MNRLRFVALFVLLAGGGGIIAAIVKARSAMTLDPTLAPAFQTAGRYSQTADRLVAKVIPVGALDEKQLGQVIMDRYQFGDRFLSPSDPRVIYLNQVFDVVKRAANRPFEYKIYLSNTDVPNAFALPGGHIVVFQGLLKTLKSESELVSILAHELAHIELEHCFQAVKYNLLSRKLTGSNLGQIADFANQFLLRHSFSKTQENEADRYAFRWVTNSAYDPRGVSEAFQSLKKWMSENQSHSDSTNDVNLLRDYFLSHPPLELRVNEFKAQAALWWRGQSQDVQRYVGGRNFREFIPLSKMSYADEWSRSP